jgi:4-alpha-glucanotransferase
MGMMMPLQHPAQHHQRHEVIVRFQVWDWELQHGQEMCVSGGAPQLGNWQLHRPLVLSQTRPACWEGEVSIPTNTFPITYKYTVRPVGSGENENEIQLEHGESRLLSLPSSSSAFPSISGAGASPSAAAALKRPLTMIIQNDGDFQRKHRWRGAGVAVPVFSLRSRANSVGAGDFRDLIMLADWAAAAELSVIQILPISDTSVRGTWRDSYPYSSMCVFALHPLYLCLEDMYNVFIESSSSSGENGSRNGNKMKVPSHIQEAINQARKDLDLPDVDYEATMATKLSIAKLIFKEEGTATLESDHFKAFCDNNAEWLQPYAAFCWLKPLFGTGEHWKWGIFSDPSPQNLDRVLAPTCPWHEDIQFTYYLQYHLHCQLKRAAVYAAGLKIAFKGDLPIGVDKQSVDTWCHPTLFRMNVSTGAPPDYFDPGGQNWGFPTYNWEEMSKDGYLWWRRRLTHMGQYFNAYRIDHVLGFFRIWEIPGDCSSGLLGRFRPSIPIKRNDLDARGIWDVQRMTDPYATPALLEEVFGHDLAVEATERFFNPGPAGSGRLSLKDEYMSERTLSNFRFSTSDSKFANGMLEIRRNVLLLRDQDDPDNIFYPRINLRNSASFAALGQSKDTEQWQEQLAQLHDDHFYHWQDELWRGQALKTLPVLLQASDMLVCGEDLGMIPACVHPVMSELGIVGLRIERMPAEPDVEFGNPATYPYLTVASPSSHDTSTTRGWYEEEENGGGGGGGDSGKGGDVVVVAAGGEEEGLLADGIQNLTIQQGEGEDEVTEGSKQQQQQQHQQQQHQQQLHPMVTSSRRQRYWATALGMDGPAPPQATADVLRMVVGRHCASPSMLAIFPLQDLMALCGEYSKRPAAEETINDPTNPEHYWRWRMHVGLEDLLGNKQLLEDVRMLLTNAGRGMS